MELVCALLRLWWTVVWYTAAPALIAALAARAYLDNGGYLPFLPNQPKLYARRWVSPTGESAEYVRQVMLDLCSQTLDQALPHRYLHDPSHLKDKVVMLVYERRTNQPVMFHAAFKASYAQELVIHLGLVIVAPAWQGKHCQRLCLWNLMCCCLTYLTLDFVMTDVADSPSNTKLVSDNMTDCFPNYRQPARRPASWQRDVVNFMMSTHRADFGTASDARADQSTFVVYGSNGEAGGSTVLVKHGDKRRSRASRVNAFVEHLIGAGSSNEIFHVGRCQLARFMWQEALQASPQLRDAVCTLVFLAHSPAMFWYIAIDRIDLLYGVFRSFAFWMGTSVQVEGVPYGQVRADPALWGNDSYLGAEGGGGGGGGGSGSGGGSGEAKGCLWVSNHYTWMDYGFLTMISHHMLRAVIKADIPDEGLGGWLLSFVNKRLRCISYRRGDKKSGQEVREALAEALTTDVSPVLVFPEGTSTVEGPPRRFKTGAIEVAYAAGRPVQPCAIWYSEPVGLAPESDNIGGTSNWLNRKLHVIVKFPPAVLPEQHASAAEFCAAVEAAVRGAHHEISGAGIVGGEDDGAGGKQ